MLIEVSFLVPLKEDKVVGNGEIHPYGRWKWLEKELYGRFKGWTASVETYVGECRDSHTKKKVRDESKRFFVAVEKRKLKEMKKFLKDVAETFYQKSLYTSIAGKVIYVKGKSTE